jgi:hypothetical protein
MEAVLFDRLLLKIKKDIQLCKKNPRTEVGQALALGRVPKHWQEHSCYQSGHLGSWVALLAQAKRFFEGFIIHKKVASIPIGLTMRPRTVIQCAGQQRVKGQGVTGRLVPCSEAAGDEVLLSGIFMRGCRLDKKGFLERAGRWEPGGREVMVEVVPGPRQEEHELLLRRGGELLLEVPFKTKALEVGWLLFGGQLSCYEFE